MVGATGFEPAPTCTPSKCATSLRYAPDVRVQRGERRNIRPRSRQCGKGSYGALFSAFFSTCEGRNVSTRRAEISISCPVCGLRPTRDFFSRTTKLPNPESLIFSPRSSVSFSVSKTISTISADSFLENPTLLHTLSMTSAFVMAKTIHGQRQLGQTPKESALSSPSVTHRVAHRKSGEAVPWPLC